MEHDAWTGLSFWFYILLVFCVILLIDNYRLRTSRIRKLAKNQHAKINALADSMIIIGKEVARKNFLLRRCESYLDLTDYDQLDLYSKIKEELECDVKLKNNEEYKNTKEEAGSGTTGQAGKGN